MDCLSWDGSAIMNPSSSWSSYSYNHEADGFLSLSSSYPCPIQLLQIADDSSLSNLNSARVNEMAQTISYPPDGDQNLGGGSCPSLISRPYAMSRAISTFPGASSNAGNLIFHQPVNEEQDRKTLPIGSYIESLNCLLSSPASRNAEKFAEEDDEISIILSDCRNLLNFKEAGSAVSSGVSEKKISKERKIDEAVSQDPYANNLSIESKRRSNQCQPNESCDGFKLISDKSLAKQKKSESDKASSSSSNINFQQPSIMASSSTGEPDSEAIEQMKEMIYRAAVFRPVNLREEVVQKPKRKNVRMSTDPQTVAARQRRERIGERIRVLQRLVPGGRKMDTASMLDEAARYLKFLRSQVKTLEGLSHTVGCPSTAIAFSFNPCCPMQTYFPLPLPTHRHVHNSQPWKNLVPTPKPHC